MLDHVEAHQLWSADRNFCTLGVLGGRDQRDAVFVVRQHAQRQGVLVGRAKRTGITRSGPVSEQALLGRDPAPGETLRRRRIPLQLRVPTRDGDTAQPLFSHVPSGRASVAQLARGYGKRWSRETAFLELTTTLTCEIKTLAYPQAALLTLCLALLASNAVSLIQAALRHAPGRKQVNDEVSSSSLALEISRTYDGRMIALPAPHWTCLRELSDGECAAAFGELASSGKRARDQKHPRGPKKKPPQRAPDENGQHVSTAKLLAQR